MESLSKQVDCQIQLLSKLRESVELRMSVNLAVEQISEALHKKLPLLICGNGGSASDALHITGEFVGRFLKERDPFNVICLNSNVAVMTAWANDYEYGTIFSRQVEAHAVPGGTATGHAVTPTRATGPERVHRELFY